MGQKLPQMTHIMLAESAAVMRPVQLAFDVVQLDCKPRAVGALNLGPQVVQQRLDFAPVKVAADRFGEDRFQNALVLLTHRCTGGSSIETKSGSSLPKNSERTGDRTQEPTFRPPKFSDPCGPLPAQ